MQTPELTKLSVEDWLNNVVYENDDDYTPSAFAIQFVNFIKLVNGQEGEENVTPVMHLRMIDNMEGDKENVANLCHRGSGKTTLTEYLFLYLAMFGEIPGFGEIDLAIYVSDSIDNGVKNMRKNLEYRYTNSEFLTRVLPAKGVKFTDTRWEFTNIAGGKLIVKGYGARTGVRGAKEMGKRPQLAVLDDLVSDEDARSPTIIASIEDTVYKAIDYALHPTHRKTIWSGTPFNASDPLYKAVESGAWHVNIYPVCESFPCAKEDFRGSWPDRFPYEFVKRQYEKAMKTGKIADFNQELMLRIMSDDERLISDGEIQGYDRKTLLRNRDHFNFYITTDFATTESAAGDFSVISVWAYSANGDWFWVDGICKKQYMDKNIDDLFRLAQEYKPLKVGVEVSGQQGGFISWIQEEMINKNCFFNLASDNNSSRPGVRPNTNKMVRFNIVVPWFKAGKMYFPMDMEESAPMIECKTELRLASAAKFKSKHDDFIDTISMLASMGAWKPSGNVQARKTSSGVWEFEDDDTGVLQINSYVV